MYIIIYYNKAYITNNKAYITVAVHHCSKPGDVPAFAPEYLALLPHYFTKWLWWFSFSYVEISEERSLLIDYWWKKDTWMHTYFIYGQNSCSMKLTTINSSEAFGIFTVLGNCPSYLVIKHTCKSKVKLLVHLGVNVFLLHKAPWQLPIFILSLNLPILDITYI